MQIEVKGHSGCQIDIFRENNELFINKSSYDKKYLNRLLKQAEKQQAASILEYRHIRVPQIFQIRQDSDSVSVKMEYIYSKNFIEYFESAGFEQISYFIKELILFVEKEIQASPLQTVSVSKLKDKFADILLKVNKNSLLNRDPEIQVLMERSAIVFNSLDSITMPIGICHGDLTFSNILFNGTNYYLIDFLDSFIESPLLDIVKIRQDSAYLWSQLMYIHEYDELRLQIVSEKIDQGINTYFFRYDWYKQYYQFFQLMNFLRILQYAQEEKIIVYLKKVIKQLHSEF